MGYLVQYLRYFQGYCKFRKINYGDICRFIRDICLFTSRDIGYLLPPYTSLIYRKLELTEIILSKSEQGLSKNYVLCVVKNFLVAVSLDYQLSVKMAVSNKVLYFETSTF